MSRLLDRYFSRKAVGHWKRTAQNAPHEDLPLLRQQRDQARVLRAQLDRLIQIADGRLTRPHIGTQNFPRPLGTDWAWRPDLWGSPLPVTGLVSLSRKAQLDDSVALFHDCPLAEIAVRQIRNNGEKDLAPFSLAIDVFSFQGSFLSVSVELPGSSAEGLTRQHLVRTHVTVDRERPAEVFARLNIQNGPNTEQVLRKLEPQHATSDIDFDLAHLSLNERRIEKMWLDLIIQDPGMNRVVLRDLTLCRHHRADL